MKRIPFRLVLPLMNLVLAPALIWWGELQRAIFTARIQADADIFGISPSFVDSTYVPLGTQLCTALNAPAQLGAAVVTDALPYGALFYRAIFLALVFFVWWTVGRRLDRAPFAAHGPERLPFAMVELAFGAVLLAGTIVTNWRTTPVSHVGAAAWSVFMIASAFARMRRPVREYAGTLPMSGPPPVSPGNSGGFPEPTSAEAKSETAPPTSVKTEPKPAQQEPGENRN